MIKNMKGYKKFLEENKFAPSIADAIGEEMANELDEKIRAVDPETTWIDILDSLRKNHKISEFQSGMLLGFFSAYQSLKESGLLDGVIK